MTDTKEAQTFDLDRYKILPATKGEHRIFDAKPEKGEPRTVFTGPPGVCQDKIEMLIYTGKVPVTPLSVDAAIMVLNIIAMRMSPGEAADVIRQVALAYDVKAYLLEQERAKSALLFAACPDGDSG